MKKILTLSVSILTLSGCTAAIEEQVHKDWQAVKSYEYSSMFSQLFGVDDVKEAMHHMDKNERYSHEMGCTPYMDNTRTQTYSGVNDSYVYVKCSEMAHPNQKPQRLDGR